MSRFSESVRVDVAIDYDGFKATHFKPHPASVRTDIILKDLDAFRCYHPKRSSITVPEPGRVHFFWTGNNKNILMKSVVTKLKHSNPVYQETINKLSIRNITVKMSNDNTNIPPSTSSPSISTKQRPMSPTVNIETLTSPNLSPTSLIERIGNVARLDLGSPGTSSSAPSTSSPAPPPPFSAHTIPPVFPVVIKQEKDTEELHSLTSPLHSHSLVRTSKRRRPRSVDADIVSPRRPAQRPRWDEDVSVTVTRHLNDLRNIRRRIAEFRQKESELVYTLKGLDPNLDSGPCDIETQLEEERKQRREAEEALDDVRRECTHPFIVPQIMDAFIKVSKLTTKAIHGD